MTSPFERAVDAAAFERAVDAAAFARLPPDAHPFAYWVSRGYRIHKGSKAVGFYRGEPYFISSQCYRPKPRTYSRGRYHGGDPDPGGDREYDGGGFWGDWADASDANY